MRLEGKVAVVTGSSRGIGKAIALAFAREGADVVVAARTAEEGRAPGTIHQTAEEIAALGRRALAVQTDVSQDEQVENLRERTLEEFGRCDILVNNAAALFRAPLLETPIRRFDLVMRVNLRAAFLCCQAFLPTMVEQKSGHIINISHGARTELGPGSIAYGISKTGIALMTTGLAREMAEHNIAVNCLWPEGTRDTYATRYFGMGDPKEWLSAEVMGDAAVAMVLRDPKEFSGRAVTDLEVLREEGITDFSQYRVEG